MPLLVRTPTYEPVEGEGGREGGRERYGGTEREKEYDCKKQKTCIYIHEYRAVTLSNGLSTYTLFPPRVEPVISSLFTHTW